DRDDHVFGTGLSNKLLCRGCSASVMRCLYQIYGQSNIGCDEFSLGTAFDVAGQQKRAAAIHDPENYRAVISGQRLQIVHRIWGKDLNSYIAELQTVAPANRGNGYSSAIKYFF